MRIAYPLTLLLLGFACGGPPDHGTTTTDDEVEVPVVDGRLAFSHRIDDEETWHQLAARPLNHAVARTEVVKFLIDLEDEGRVWFTDTTRWDIHFDFAVQFLSRPGHVVPAGSAGHSQFNVQQYRSPDRRFVLGSLVRYLDSGIWSFEMIAGDNLDGPRVLEAFEQVRDLVYFGEALRYRPMSEIHEEQIASVRDRMPIVSADQVFLGVHYQPLTLGVTFGTLRFVRGALDLSSVRPDQILVLERLPDEIPVVGGVISEQLQAPLGHVAILCGTRQTPNMALRNALSDPRLTALEGQLVRLEVGAQDLTIAPASIQEAEAAWVLRRPQAPQTPVIDPTDRGLPEMCTLNMGDARSVGAKAAQLGEACQLGGVIRTPGGFAIPFYRYLQHLQSARVANGIEPMLADPQFRQDSHVRDTRLAALRAHIQRAPVDRRFLADLRARIQAFEGEPRVILRSSTNAEDLAGFTGAGLYRSIVIGSDVSEAELANALREVWASVWLLGAYEEREWYRIDHRTVAMGTLVQPFVDGAASNGVAITRNPFYEGRPGFFVNAQALGGSVTGAAGDEIPEQHLIYTYSSQIESETLARSSRNGGAPLLRQEEIVELAAVLERVHEHFLPRWQGQGANCVEVEFLIAGPERDVVLLQARPYTIRYQAGQLWGD